MLVVVRHHQIDLMQAKWRFGRCAGGVVRVHIVNGSVYKERAFCHMTQGDSPHRDSYSVPCYPSDRDLSRPHANCVAFAALIALQASGTTSLGKRCADPAAACIRISLQPRRAANAERWPSVRT